MLKSLNQLIGKLKILLKSQMFLYLVFGGLTTLVNLVSFWLLRKANVFLDVSVIISWFLSMLFAFVTNRKFVFKSKSKLFFKELYLFFGSRIFSGAVEFLLMHFLSHVNFINEVLLKFFLGVIVTILNFVLSKLIVFKSSNEKKSGDKNA